MAGNSNIALQRPSDSLSFLSIPLDSLSENTLNLPFPVYLKLAGDFVLFRAAKTEVGQDRLTRLSERISALYVPKDHWRELAGYFEAPSRVWSAENKAMAEVIRARFLMHLYWEQMRECQELYPTTLEKMRDWCGKIATHLPQLQFGKHVIRRYPDNQLYFSTHNLNVAVYSAAVALRLGLPASEVGLVALSGILHNLGHLTLPRELYFKQGKPNKEEWIQVRNHPVRGYDILIALNAEPEVANVALQHHERGDGSGYPNGLLASKIHLFAKICAAADVFDALLSQRSHESAHSYQDAVSILRREVPRLDAAVVDTLVSLGF